MHLMSVLLPAPLSPTSAITSPGYARKSTPLSASTGPKLLETPWSSSVGVMSVIARVEGARRGAGRPSAPRGLAVLRVDPRADVALLVVAVRDHELPVLLREPDRRQEHRRHVADAVADLA